jgi:hypothetical protein
MRGQRGRHSQSIDHECKRHSHFTDQELHQVDVDENETSELASSEAAGLERGAYRDNTPSVMTAVLPSQRRKMSSVALFWLGFIMPWCWIFGGWPVDDVGAVRQEKGGDVEKGAERDMELGTARKSWMSRWLYHPDPWVRRCRIAALLLLPLVAVGGVVGVIVLAVMRGR